MICRKLLMSLFLLGCLLTASFGLTAQERPEESVIQDPSTFLWLGGYGEFRLTDKLFWSGELHYRRTEHDGISFIGRNAQIYNRHGLTYVHSKKFSTTVGGVLRLNFSPEPGDDRFKGLVLEPRIWHQYVFAVPFDRFMLYHRLRFEHRWSRSNRKGSDYTFRNRYRYKFYMKIPLNNRKLMSKTYYFSPDVELIMQSGTSVVDSPFEDLRIYPHFGYIANSNYAFSLGMMYTTGQLISAGYEFRTRWVLRMNVYISLDFRKFKEKLPQINIED